jgi:splicing factor 3B subunit 4
MAHQGYGFCEFLTEEDAEYACKIMNQIKLWGKPIRVNKVRHRIPGPSEALLKGFASLCVPDLLTSLVLFQASSDKKQLDVGANLFIGNLDENVDERLLYDTFSAFGMMATTAKVSPVASVP